MVTAFVINLDRDIERMSVVTTNLDKFKIPYIRVPAVNGNDIPGYEKYVDIVKYSQNNRRVMPRFGEVGCYLSHLKAMNCFLNTSAESCIIMEDDVEFLPEILNVLTALNQKRAGILLNYFVSILVCP